MRKLLFLVVTLSVVMCAGWAAALDVTPTNDGATLVNSILGSGITLTPGSILYSGANNAASGIFSNGGNASNGIGFNSGILLTTGYAVGAKGPNNTESYTGPGAATSLQFSFTSSKGDLFFNYVFGSEEYNEYVGSQYNDYFKFFLDGTNIALIPGTSTQVSINNVNSGLNSAYYRNNAPGPYNTQYDGLTTVLVAEKLGLSAGEHTIQMIISDVGDALWDSGVFIQGNTFSDAPTPIDTVPEPSTLLLLGGGLVGLVAFRSRLKKA